MDIHRGYLDKKVAVDTREVELQRQERQSVSQSVSQRKRHQKWEAVGKKGKWGQGRRSCKADDDGLPHTQPTRTHPSKHGKASGNCIIVHLKPEPRGQRNGEDKR